MSTGQLSRKLERNPPIGNFAIQISLGLNRQLPTRDADLTTIRLFFMARLSQATFAGPLPSLVELDHVCSMPGDQRVSSTGSDQDELYTGRSGVS